MYNYILYIQGPSAAREFTMLHERLHRAGAIGPNGSWDAFDSDGADTPGLDTSGLVEICVEALAAYKDAGPSEDTNTQFLYNATAILYYVVTKVNDSNRIAIRAAASSIRFLCAVTLCRPRTTERVCHLMICAYQVKLTTHWPQNRPPAQSSW